MTFRCVMLSMRVLGGDHGSDGSRELLPEVRHFRMATSYTVFKGRKLFWCGATVGAQQLEPFFKFKIHLVRDGLDFVC